VAPPPQQAPSGNKTGAVYQVLGKTGLKVSRLGFGCMITSDGSVIQRAADAGINYFDTARVYQNGNNERMVGDALKSRRKGVFLSSKTVSRSQQEAMMDLGRSLNELRTDYLDIWFLHNLTGAGELTPGMTGALASAKKSGKVRFTGVSTHRGQAGVIRDAIKSGVVDVVMTSYNFAMERALIPVIEEAHKAGLGVIAMKVMAGGFRNEGYYPSPGELRKRFKREGALLAALKWVLVNRNVDVAIPSMVDTDQLEENLKAMSEPFTEADVKLLSAHLEDIRPLYCRMCGRCEGACPKGLPVADVLRCLTYAEGYGNFPLGREQFRQLPGMPMQVRCGDCGTCRVHCPHGVRIAERMSRAQDLFA
jgi:predicted aldo/keto reductase-like oxidoreductase